jgi:hypothetical protein
MKQAIAIGLLLLTLGCGHDPVKPPESSIHGDVIKIIPVARDTRLRIIWTLTVQCMEKFGYVQSVPAPPVVVLVRGQIDCGGEPAVGCAEGTTTVWLTTDDAVFKQGISIIAHEFIHIILHGIGINGENHPAFSCETIVKKEI